MVIVVIGNLMTIAVPSYQIFMAQRRFTGRPEGSCWTMAARMKAVSLNQREKVSFGRTRIVYVMTTDINENVTDHEGEYRERHPSPFIIKSRP